MSHVAPSDFTVSLALQKLQAVHYEEFVDLPPTVIRVNAVSQETLSNSRQTLRIASCALLFAVVGGVGAYRLDQSLFSTTVGFVSGFFVGSLVGAFCVLGPCS